MIWPTIPYLILLLSSEIMATVFRGLCQEIRLDYCGNQFLKTTCHGDVADLRPLDFYFHYPYARDYQVVNYCYAFRPDVFGGCLESSDKEFEFNISLYSLKIDSNLPVVKKYHKCTPEKDFITVFYYPNTGQLIWTCLDDRHSRDGPHGTLILIATIKVSSAGEALEERTETLSKVYGFAAMDEELSAEITYWKSKISDMFCQARMPAECENFPCRFDIPISLKSKPYFKTYIVVGAISIVLLFIFYRTSRKSLNRVASLALGK